MYEGDFLWHTTSQTLPPSTVSSWRAGAGTLVVSGEGLHIGKLSLDGGELHVDGRIDALTYEDAPEERGGSFFSRLFA